MKHALDEAAILAEDFEGETTALEVVEDAGVVTGDVHAAAQGGEVDVRRWISCKVIDIKKKRGRNGGRKNNLCR